MNVLDTAIGQSRFLAPLASLQESVEEAAALFAQGEANAPSAAALQEAETLLDSLPDWAPTPDALVEPSGAIAFEWDWGADRYLILALKGNGTLEFSAVVGRGNRRFGVSNFTGGLGWNESRLLQELHEMAR